MKKRERKINPRWFDCTWDPLRPSEISGVDEEEHPTPIWRRRAAISRDNHHEIDGPHGHQGCPGCDDRRFDDGGDCPCSCHLLERPDFDE